MMDVGKNDRLSTFNDETDTIFWGSGHREIELQVRRLVCSKVKIQTSKRKIIRGNNPHDSYLEIIDYDLRHLLVVFVSGQELETVLHSTCRDPDIVCRDRCSCLPEGV
jgi:hypothetical protein